jgi:hypothetical protein
VGSGGRKARLSAQNEREARHFHADERKTALNIAQTREKPRFFDQILARFFAVSVARTRIKIGFSACEPQNVALQAPRRAVALRGPA